MFMHSFGVLEKKLSRYLNASVIKQYYINSSYITPKRESLSVKESKFV